METTTACQVTIRSKWLGFSTSSQPMRRPGMPQGLESPERTMEFLRRGTRNPNPNPLRSRSRNLSNLAVGGGSVFFFYGFSREVVCLCLFSFFKSPKQSKRFPWEICHVAGASRYQSISPVQSPAPLVFVCTSDWLQQFWVQSAMLKKTKKLNCGFNAIPPPHPTPHPPPGKNKEQAKNK